MSAFELISHERDGNVAVLTLNLPERLNPLSRDLQVCLREWLARLAKDTSVRALVLTGAGRAFCSGADLSRISGAAASTDSASPITSLGQRMGEIMETLTNRMIEDLHEMPIPVVSAVNGGAVGGGIGLALAADVVLAARSAYFYMPFMPRLGIIPDLGSTWFLERFAGRSRAVGLALLGDRLPADQAAQWGLVWKCVDDACLRQEALAIAHRLALVPAHGAREIRRAFQAAGSNTLREQLQYEADRQRELFDRPDFIEGVNAFMEKRAPVFRSR